MFTNTPLRDRVEHHADMLRTLERLTRDGQSDILGACLDSMRLLKVTGRVSIDLLGNPAELVGVDFDLLSSDSTTVTAYVPLYGIQAEYATVTASRGYETYTELVHIPALTSWLADVFSDGLLDRGL